MDWIALIDVLWKAVLIPLAVAGVFYLVKLTGLTLSQEQKADLKAAVETSMLSVEEQTLRAWKDHGAKVPGPEKLAQAVVKARELSKDGLQQYTDDELKTYTEAALVKARPLISSPPPPLLSSSMLPPPMFPRASMPPTE